MKEITRRRFLGLLAAGPLAASCAGPQAGRGVGPGLGLVADPLRPRGENEPLDLPGATASRADLELFARPKLGDEQIVGRVAGLRPFRRGGLRLELESIGGFPVIHNYGHGGGGITTAWGCAEEVLRLARAAGMEPGLQGAGPRRKGSSPSAGHLPKTSH